MLRTRLLVAAAAIAAPALVAQPAFAEKFAAVDSNNRLYTFSDANPAKWTRVSLRGLGSGERIVGLDVRPATRQLFALTNRSRLYIVPRASRTVTAVGNAPFAPALSGRSFDFDFNPTVDRIRLTWNSGQNLRVNPEDGSLVATDAPLVYKKSDPGDGTKPAVLGSAYTNNTAGAMSTTLYTIDTNFDRLLIQSPPEEGILDTVGQLGYNISAPLGFDISAKNGKGYALARVRGATGPRLFRINLASGLATDIGAVKKAPSLVALAALTGP